eukprot:gene3800-4729_t
MALPILGNLNLLGKRPHVDLTNLSKQYGNSILRFWMGDHYTLVVTDPHLVREIWVKNFDNFINRPHFPSMKLFSNNYRDLALGDEQYWRPNRAIVSAAFTRTKIKNLATTIIENEGGFLCDSLKTFVSTGEPLYPRLYCKKYALNIVLKYIFSEEIPYTESVHEGNMDKLQGPIDQIFKAAGSARLDDFISIIAPFSYIYRRINGMRKRKVRNFVQEIFEKHKSSLDRQNPKDLLDTILIESEEKNWDPQISLSIAVDLILAGTDTSASTIEYFMLYMSNYPEIQNKAFTELEKVVGKGNKVNLSHRQSTPYLNAVMKEVMRMKPVAPLGLPRSCHSDITIDGIFIPKGAQLIQNIYGLLHSPDYWDRPNEFIPERFLTADDQPENIAFIPFGVGQRNCIGQSLAYEEIYIAISNILMNFEISSIDGKMIDDTELFGLTIKPKIFGIKKNWRNKNEAKGVGIAFPFIGNLNKLGKSPHIDLLEMTRKNGDGYFRFWMGDQYTLFISDPLLIREIWIDKFEIFMNRPLISSIQFNYKKYPNIFFGIGKQWYKNRSIASLLFTSTKIKQISVSIIEKEVYTLIDFLKEKINSD